MVILIGLMLSLLCAPLIPLYMWTKHLNNTGEGGGAGDSKTHHDASDDDSVTINGAVLAKIMGLIVACAFSFGLVLSVCTRAKKHEIFASCAA